MLTGDDLYIRLIIGKYRAATGPGSTWREALRLLEPLIRLWAAPYLLRISPSGSFAKGTAICGTADVDLFISLSPSTPFGLREIYMRLFEFLTLRGLAPRLQNVSIGVTIGGMSVDLVPGRKQLGNTTDHSLYHRRSGTWIQTNVHQHILFVRRSRRLNEIRALKIWRRLHNLDFPSFYLELAVIHALRGRHIERQLARNLAETLRFLAHDLSNTRIIDPAKSNNIVSDDLNDAEKRAVAGQAARSLGMPWSNVIW